MMPPTPWQWQFPPRQERVPRDDYERDRQNRQIHKGEVRAHIAFSSRDDDGLLPYAMELMDVIHTCETALREFDPCQLDRIKALVIRKNDDRGYYDGRA
ncbi:hypothetical protein [Eggerthella timonensis]|uniref:hypothetical protein n=1 Tax=Eggerthella timonensis TaxID=1871008 RepID=UPI000C7651C2|nr:hypothetical protein [Eggerthella timonensis]